MTPSTHRASVTLLVSRWDLHLSMRVLFLSAPVSMVQTAKSPPLPML